MPDDVGVPGPYLLGLARESIDYGFDNKAPLPVQLDELPSTLAEPAATFTTLRLAGALRGCCGRLEAAQPLAIDVAHSAFTAAFRDPRFEPLRRDANRRLLRDLDRTQRRELLERLEACLRTLWRDRAGPGVTR